MSDAEELTDHTLGSVTEVVGERSAGDGRESSHDVSPDISTDEEMEEEGSQHPSSQQEISTSNVTKESPKKEGSAYSSAFQQVPQRARSTDVTNANNGCVTLPWGAKKETSSNVSTQLLETNLRPGQYVMQVLFGEFAAVVDKKIEFVLQEPIERSLSKSLQRGEDAKFDQLVIGFGSVAEHCLPSLLRTLMEWYNRPGHTHYCFSEAQSLKFDPNKNKDSVFGGGLVEKRDLAMDFILCLVLIEVMKQLHVHPGHDELVHAIEDLAFKHFRYREHHNNPNSANINVVADLYAEVIGVLAQSRFQSVRRRFMTELKELRSKEASTHTTHCITSLLMGMKFFRVKMVPIEEFEASFQFMQECAQYFLEVRDKDIKHALAGLFVEILVPVAAAVKNEVNVPCLKNFVEMLYSSTLDTATKNKHKLAIFPLLTCLLCVSQKIFFLSNWHYFLTMCLQHLKNKDPKMARVALESLYRLLWVYMIRIKCESNSATHSRLQAIVNSLFPKGSKTVVPRDTPLNIFVKIIQFIAQERLDFAMRDIMFDLLSVGRPIKVILSPERMAIGLRAFLVVADSLQQKEGDPPMPRTLAVLPSGNTLRVKKIFLNKMLTEDAARNIGLAAYYPLVRKTFNDILKALDTQFGKPLMMTNTQNVNKDSDELIGGERKAKMDLFRTCVAAIPRLIPDGMSGQELVEMLSRLTVHMDEELKTLAFQSLQGLVIDFPEWRHEVLYNFIQFVVRDVGDSFPQLLDSLLRMVLQLYTAWRTALSTESPSAKTSPPHLQQLLHLQLRQRGDDLEMVRYGEALCVVMLCACRVPPRKLAVLILKELKSLAQIMNAPDDQPSLIDVMDRFCPSVVDSVSAETAFCDKNPLPTATAQGNGGGGASSGSSGANNYQNSCVDLQWLAERSTPVWTGVNPDTDKGQAHPIPPDVWPQVLLGFLRPERVLGLCPRVVMNVWPLVYTRAANLYPTIDPLQPNDNRASLLRSATTLKKPVCERDIYLDLWRNYVVVACRVVPPVYCSVGTTGSFAGSSTTSSANSTSTPLHQRCASPDVSVGSSPDSGMGSGASGSGTVCSSVAPPQLYKLLVPLLRSELTEVRDIASLALGNINHHALADVMEELVPNVRESLDRKQENMRRRRRRDTLRLQLMKIFNSAATAGTFALSDNVLEPDFGVLLKPYVDYLDGARAYLESDQDKDNTLLTQIKVLFCKFVRQLIKSFSLEQQQLILSHPRGVRANLFNMFGSWSGSFGLLLGHKQCESTNEELELSALEASVAVLCAGPAFHDQILSDESSLYAWLDALLVSDSDKVCKLAHEAIVLLLEANSDCGFLLDWLVEKCYTAEHRVADECFNDLATIFSAREYPCDRYTAIMTVSLLYTACPRTEMQETALQLLQILDARFFGNSHSDDMTDLRLKGHSSTLDVFLTTTYSRSHMSLSKQLAQLHPELTMPIFSEISSRLQTARSSVRPLLFSCLFPWLYNMELVDPSLPPPHHPYSGAGQFFAEAGLRREGWGSVEATEMVLNNLFYITAKFSEDHPREVQELWGALCSCWPNNLRVIIRYLLIIVGMAPNHLLPHAHRVAISIGIERPDRLVEELMVEMGSVETLCLIERTETPPFYRVTAIRKCSGGHEDNAGKYADGGMESESGTLHTKRHSGDQHDVHAKEQRSAPGSLRSISSLGSGVSSVIVAENNAANAATITPATANIKTSRPTSSLAPNSQGTSNNMEDSAAEDNIAAEDNFAILRRQQSHHHSESAATVHISALDGVNELVRERKGEGKGGQYEPPQPHPLPMPEYGGYFAPLTEYLPDSSQPITTFHRCFLSVLLMSEVLVAGIDVNCHSVDWSVHVPLMLHIIILGMDHSKHIVHLHCKRLLMNLLTVVGDHRDHLGIARVLLSRKTCSLGYKLIPHNTFHHHINFIDEAPKSRSDQTNTATTSTTKPSHDEGATTTETPTITTLPPSKEVSSEAQASLDTEVSDDESNYINNAQEAAPTKFVLPSDELQYNIKALLDALTNSEDDTPLWSYEDITPKQLSIRSAQQLANFVRHSVAILSDSLPHSHLEERLAQISLHLALSCSSRHYAGRSLQVLRCLHVSLSSRMLSELLSRLVETVAEQGEDMQGYVTELMLTLESAVDALHSDFRPIEFVKELFKSTPNLNNKERKAGAINSMYSTSLHHRIHHPYGAPAVGVSGYQVMNPGSPGHLRSTSFSISYAKGKHLPSPTNEMQAVGEMRGRSGTDADSRYRQQQMLVGGSLSRSRSAQSLKMLADQTQDDKLTVLSQLFWISVSMLETDYEYEFLLATRLLDKVLSRLPLDRPDTIDKVEKLQYQLKWRQFPGVHALLLKGCTSPTLYEPAVSLMARLTRYIHLHIIDPSPTKAGFAMNVIGLLPYMLHHYEDANAICIQAAENIAQISQECSDGKQLQNLATVMTLYSRRNFSKESFQWTKCVVKYLHDSYAAQAAALFAFLVEILEKGPTWVHCPVLNIIYCLMHYTDLTSAPHTPAVNAELLSVIAKYLEGNYWKEALRILKLAVTSSSTLVLPVTSSLRSGGSNTHSATSPMRGDGLDTTSTTFLTVKKELPGRTLEFSFNVDLTPEVGRKVLYPASAGSTGPSALGTKIVETSLNEAASFALSAGQISASSPRRPSFSPYDTTTQCNVSTPGVAWRRPWQSQCRVRERLVNLLNTCGQRVGLPKSPSVIFSQSSELERQSSMASSTEEVSAGAANADDRTPADDITSSENQFAVFKDFDFLEYELESQGEESVDNFNLWGVRRRSPTNSTSGVVAPSSSTSQVPPSSSTTTTSQASTAASTPQVLHAPPVPPPEPDWWDEDGSVSPLDDTTSHTASEMGGAGAEISDAPLREEGIERSVEEGLEDEESSPNVGMSSSPSVPNKLSLSSVGVRRMNSRSSLSDESSEGDLGDLTPCNPPSNMMFTPTPRPPPAQPLHISWKLHLTALIQPQGGLHSPAYSCSVFSALFSECVSKSMSVLREASHLLGQFSSNAGTYMSHLETVAIVSPLPYVYLDSNLLEVNGLHSKVKASFIALHEHTDTFFDKLDTALMVLDTMKGSGMKVSMTSDSEDSTVSRGGMNLLMGAMDDHQVEVCRALYRLHFQVSLMYDTYIKMLMQLLHTARHNQQATDHSVELSALRAKLVAATEQMDSVTPIHSPPPPTTPPAHMARVVPEGEECETDSVVEGFSLEEDIVGGDSIASSGVSYTPSLPTPTHSQSSALTTLPTPTHSTASTIPHTTHSMPSLPQANHKVLQLVANQKWREVVQYSYDNYLVWQQPGMPYHNITTVLNIYCTYLAEKQPGMVAVCCTESYLSDTSQTLSDANFSALGALRVIETDLQAPANRPVSASHSTLYYSSAPPIAPPASSLYSTVATPPLLSSTNTLSSSSHYSTTYLHPSSLSSQLTGLNPPKSGGNLHSPTTSEPLMVREMVRSPNSHHRHSLSTPLTPKSGETSTPIKQSPHSDPSFTPPTSLKRGARSSPPHSDPSSTPPPPTDGSSTMPRRGTLC